MTKTTTRAGRLHDRLQELRDAGEIGNYYCYSPGDRGRRWIVWGRIVGRDIYGAGECSSCERAYTTRQLEEMLARMTGASS